MANRGEGKELLFFKKLDRENVEYVLIGRTACILYGLPLYTFDYDIAIRPTIENIRKLLKIAEELKLTPTRDPHKILSKRVPFFSLQNDIKVDVLCVKRIMTAGGEGIVFDEV